MSRRSSALVSFGVLFVVQADGALANDANDWPVHYRFSDGTDIGLAGVYRYDLNDFSNDTLTNGKDAFVDSHTNRRKELGLTLKKNGVYDAIVDFEYQGKTIFVTHDEAEAHELADRVVTMKDGAIESSAVASAD